MTGSETKCGMCDRRFEAEKLDREDPMEQRIYGVPVRCPNCTSTMLENVKVTR
jgi:DNA-directed RNA polymerase subunit RPC12/RpoP